MAVDELCKCDMIHPSTTQLEIKDDEFKLDGYLGSFPA